MAILQHNTIYQPSWAHRYKKFNDGAWKHLRPCATTATGRA